MRCGDPRGKGGGGLWPLQGHNRRWDLDKRPAQLAWRLIDRLDAQDQLGHYVYEEGSVGDVNGGQLWKKKDDDREIPMWRFATPVVVTERNKSGETKTTGRPPAGKGCGLLNTMDVLPVKDKDWAKDDRLESLAPTRPKVDGKDAWPKFPRNYYGISLVADNEGKQEDLFHPTDPRIVSPNVAGDAMMGSLMVDLNGNFEVDLDRMARMQSFARVIKKPAGCASWLNQNSIAWNIGFSGCSDVRGGLVIDFPSEGGGGGGGGATHPGTGGGGGGGGPPHLPPWFPTNPPPSNPPPFRPRRGPPFPVRFIIQPDPPDRNRPSAPIADRLPGAIRNLNLSYIRGSIGGFAGGGLVGGSLV